MAARIGRGLRGHRLLHDRRPRRGSRPRRRPGPRVACLLRSAARRQAARGTRSREQSRGYIGGRRGPRVRCGGDDRPQGVLRHRAGRCPDAPYYTARGRRPFLPTCGRNSRRSSATGDHLLPRDGATGTAILMRPPSRWGSTSASSPTRSIGTSGDPRHQLSGSARAAGRGSCGPARTPTTGRSRSSGENVPGGLQVWNRAGDWVDVATPPGSFVVNIGDLMMHWTNDRWISTLHRVVNPPRGGAGPAAPVDRVLLSAQLRRADRVPAGQARPSTRPSCPASIVI